MLTRMTAIRGWVVCMSNDIAKGFISWARNRLARRTMLNQQLDWLSVRDYFLIRHIPANFSLLLFVDE